MLENSIPNEQDNYLPVHILKGLTYFTFENLNEKLFKDNKECGFYNGKWSVNCHQRGILFDLSQVRWVSISAASLLTLWIERAKKDNIKIYVALPYKKLTAKEVKKIENEESGNGILYSNQEKRSKANQFLKLLQFDRVIKCEHIDKNEVSISEELEYQSEEVTKEQFNKAFNTVYSIKENKTDFTLFDYKHIVPLTWIDSAHVEKAIENLETLFEKVLANKDKGIEIFDVLALKNVLLSELLKNVSEHSGSDTKHGLLAIGLMSIKTLGKYRDEKIPHAFNIEQDYINWIINSKFENFIEIYFGDSGQGIFASGLEDMYYKKINNNKDENSKLNILSWAFDKWSSRKEIENELIRGTKGLYRVKRIIDKYEGIVLVKTEDVIGGYQKGGNSPSIFIPNKGNNQFNENMVFPGTFINVKLCTYRDVTKFNFNFKINNINNHWQHIFCYLPKKESLAEWIKNEKELQKNNNILLILEFKDSDSQYIQDVLLELKELSNIRHDKSMIVIYLVNEVGNDVLGNITDSINKTIEKEHDGEIRKEEYHHSFENIYSPILLIGKNNKIFWFGENKLVLDALDAIYESRTANLNELNYFKNLNKDEQILVRQYFQTDAQIIQIDENYNLVFNFNNIQTIFDEYISRKKTTQEQHNKPICTPKLNVVNEWYDVSAILNDDGNYILALGLYLLFKENIHKYDVSKKSTHVLIDHSQQYDLAFEFAKLMGILESNIVNIMNDVDYNIPKRTQLFNEGDDVIIITTIISSSETIKRLIKFVQRDLARTVVILSLIDKRENDETIETWGITTQVLSIHKMIQTNTNQNNKFDELLTQIDSCNTYISPNYKKENKEGIKYKIADELKDHLINNNAIYYNHIGNKNNRHFTFYLDKQNIIKYDSFIGKNILEKINSWVNINKINKFNLITPQYRIEGVNIWKDFVNHMKLDMKDKNFNVFMDLNIDNPNLKQRGDFNVFLDFGVFSGNTINKFLEKLESPEKVLIIILFSQFHDSSGNFFYKRIRELEYESYQEDLFDLSDGKEKRTKMANIQIDFLYDLPIDVYNSSTCPICEHERMLDFYKMNNKYMIDFCEDRKEKLKIRDGKIINNQLFPYDFYNTKLSSRLIMKMFEFKILLKKALSNTQYRIEILRVLVAIWKNLENEIIDPESDLYAFLYLVSHEVLWFQKEPLVFRLIRKIITKITRSVAIRKLTDIINKFKEIIADDKICEDIAIRYKYASITVLRSSDKSEFCKNISKIIENSVKRNGKLSNNLVQNTFYHIYSLQINRHNRNIRYFQDIDEELQLLKIMKILKKEQLFAFDDIKYCNIIILQSFGMDNDFVQLSPEDIQIKFKLFKDKFIELYSSKPHPIFYSKFIDLDFRKLDGREDIKKNDTQSNSDYYELFNNKILRAQENWNCVKESFLALIVNYLPQIKIFRSMYFQEAVFIKYENKIKLFSDIICELTIKNILDDYYYENYHSVYDSIYKNLINFKKVDYPESNDSVLKKFIQDIPSNLFEVINAVFCKIDFKDCNKNDIDPNLFIFYPKSMLIILMQEILNNIREKKNDKIFDTLSNISIKFETKRDDKFIIIKITNTETSKFKPSNNREGALSQFREDLTYFNGELDYDIDKENDLFILNIKFLSYEVGIL